MILETGDRQPEAIALYEAAGYERIPNFGHYRDEPGCVLLRPRPLSPARRRIGDRVVHAEPALPVRDSDRAGGPRRPPA